MIPIGDGASRGLLGTQKLPGFQIGSYKNNLKKTTIKQLNRNKIII